MKKLVLFCTLLFLCAIPLLAQTKLEKEYDACLQRLTYAKKSGFIYDGLNKIPEVKVAGSEYTFYTEASNIFVKVIDTKTKQTYFTRCFEFNDVGGYLGVGNYRLEQQIPLNGDYWNLFKAAKNVNITVCTATTCVNTQIQLYEINAPILTVTDGIFYTFGNGAEKKLSQLTFSLKSKAMPDIDIEKEKETVDSLINRIKNTYNTSEATAMITKLENALAKIK